jgi:hypothetical protein
MTTIAQPLTNVSTQCKLPITIPQAMGLMQQAQGATGGLPGGLPGNAVGALPLGGTPVPPGGTAPAATGPVPPAGTNPLPGPPRGNSVG